ncbi:MAG: DinB family protein, partial [Candidatus Doudnabacteria bacterium]|nr:DinB family protein [Candidatus Doudnabacteria bacterium]
FFITTLESERPKFRKVIEAIPEDKLEHKVHDKSRELGSLASQLAIQWYGISGVITSGAPSMDSHLSKSAPKQEMLSEFDKNFDQMMKDLAAVSDDDWENSEASMGEFWKDKKYNMAWGFLFDAIHHRGQLSTYLRGLGEKVPAIYGPSADAQS